MGVYNRYSFPANGYISAQNYKYYFDSLNASLISTSISNNVLYVNVDNIFNILFDFNRGVMGVQLNGTRYDLAVCNNTNKHTVTVCFSDDLFYIQHHEHYSTGRRMIVVYDKFDEKHYLAYTGPGTTMESAHAWYSIQEISFTCLENSLTYTHESRLKYTHDIDHIDYTDDNLIHDGEITNIVDPNFTSTTNVTPDTTVSFAGQRFYAMGPNILFPIG